MNEETKKHVKLLEEELMHKSEYDADKVLDKVLEKGDDVYHALSELGRITDIKEREKVRTLLEKYLEHPDTAWRYIALFSLSRRWGDGRYEPYFKKFILEERDERADNRELGIGLYGKFYFRTKNKEILCFILPYLLNEKEDETVRLNAYESLADIYGYKKNQIERSREYVGSKLDDILKNKIDWNFIEEIKKYCGYKK